MKNLNSGCGVDFQYFINGLYLFCFCDIFILSFLFLISVNRSFIRFRGNTLGHVSSGFLDYCILVFGVAICLVEWGALGFGCGVFRIWVWNISVMFAGVYHSAAVIIE